MDELDVPDEFCFLFNKPESIAAVRLSETHEWYWRMVADYCGSSCLQSLLDEYLHLLSEQNVDSDGVVSPLISAINLTAAEIHVDNPLVLSCRSLAENRLGRQAFDHLLETHWKRPAFISQVSRHFLAIGPFSRHYVAMNHPIKREWLEPFRQQSELEAQAYEVFFEPRLPRRTALNRRPKTSRPVHGTGHGFARRSAALGGIPDPARLAHTGRVVRS